MKILFWILVVITFICSLLGFFALADMIQWFVHFPNEFTWVVFEWRWILLVISLLTFISSLYIGRVILFKSKWLMISYGVIYLGILVNGFLGPTYLFFRSQHYSAEFKTIDEIKELKDDDEVMVVEVGGDARAYPHIWITQPHIAGDTIGGQDIVMTYCGLSHLGQAYVNNYQGQKLNLKVMTQLENNLVMFDANTQKPILQILGKPVGDQEEKFESIPSTVMSYGSFKKIYPKGKVFYNPPKFYDLPMYSMMMSAIYGKGGQYDIENEKPEFPTIKYKDKRLKSKEQVFALIIDGRPMAFTLDYIKESGNQVQIVTMERTVTLKYFPELDFVDAFMGPVEGVTPDGNIPLGFKAVRYPIYSKVLWVVWAHFHPDTLLNQI
jgi:hypothetical protein